ncbi:MAG: fatty acyl-AMP ligase [Deltaproteobacteria bacterium]|nr:fatty acyl-AMP ligase [Deltaproteobacteria bacterium]
MRKVWNGHEPKAYDADWTVRKGIEDMPSMNPRPDAGMRFILEDGSEKKFTFAELREEVMRRGRWLLSLGLKKGDHVAFIIPGPMDFVLTFLGAACVGVIPVPLYPPMGFGKLDAYIRDTARTLTIARVKMLVTQKKVEPVLWSLVGKVPTMKELVCVERFAAPLPANAPEPEAVRPDDVCFLQFTSGSTAAPKGVVVTHRSLGANSWCIQQHGLEVDVATDVAISWLPLYHDMGLIGFVISPLTVGLETVFIPTMSFIKRPSIWMETMSKHKGTITFAPNFAFGLAVKRTPPEKVKELSLGHVRLLGAGAEPNNPSTLQAFMQHFAPAGLKPEAMEPVYGMAEATLAMTFSHLDQPFRTETIDGEIYADKGQAVVVPIEQRAGRSLLEFGSCGYVFPGHTIRVIDEHGQTLPDRHVGEIVFGGPSVAAGYFDNPEATHKSFRPDGLRTGDLGYIVDGELFVTGRKKDLIILNGRNYDPQSIEWVVADVPGVRMGNVIAFSRPGDATEELVVVAETKEKQDLDAVAADIRHKIRENFQMNVADVVLLGPGALPKTTSGKLQRSKARAQYIEGTLGVEGVRTMGERGQTLTLAKHVARSAMTRLRHSVVKRASGIFQAFTNFNRNRT